MEPRSRPTRRDDVLARPGDDIFVLLMPDSGEYYSLNDVGARIWQLADGTVSIEEIARLLSEEYDAPPEMIQADAIEILTELEAEQLITVA